jgi:hypothetical protein
VSIFDTARFVISAARLEGLPPAGIPEVAFAGRSNAGKSTTINVLTRKTRLAFASKTPGRTQLVNFFAISKKRPKARAATSATSSTCRATALRRRPRARERRGQASWAAISRSARRSPAS